MDFLLLFVATFQDKLWRIRVISLWCVCHLYLFQNLIRFKWFDVVIEIINPDIMSPIHLLRELFIDICWLSNFLIGQFRVQFSILRTINLKFIDTFAYRLSKSHKFYFTFFSHYTENEWTKIKKWKKYIISRNNVVQIIWYNSIFPIREHP